MCHGATEDGMSKRLRDGIDRMTDTALSDMHEMADANNARIACFRNGQRVFGRVGEVSVQQPGQVAELIGDKSAAAGSGMPSTPMPMGSAGPSSRSSLAGLLWQGFTGLSSNLERCSCAPLALRSLRDCGRRVVDCGLWTRCSAVGSTKGKLHELQVSHHVSRTRRKSIV